MSKQQQRAAESVGELLAIPAADIAVTRNLRWHSPTEPEIKELAQDIVERGQLQPITVRRLAEGGLSYGLIFGERRLRAIE